MNRHLKKFSQSRLSRICREIGMIAAFVFAMWAPAAAEVLEVRSGDTVLELDGAGYPKVLSTLRTKDGILLCWRHLRWHDLKEPLALGFPVVVGGFRPAPGAAADWRDAAAIYKTWALKQPWCAKRLAERDDLPDWLKQGPAQVRFGREWLGQPERIEAWLEKYWAKHFKGVPLIVTFWGWEGVATWVPPQYFPPYPSEESLKRCV